MAVVVVVVGVAESVSVAEAAVVEAVVDGVADVLAVVSDAEVVAVAEVLVAEVDVVGVAPASAAGVGGVSTVSIM